MTSDLPITPSCFLRRAQPRQHHVGTAARFLDRGKRPQGPHLLLQPPHEGDNMAGEKIVERCRQGFSWCTLSAPKIKHQCRQPSSFYLVHPASVLRNPEEPRTPISHLFPHPTSTSGFVLVADELYSCGELYEIFLKINRSEIRTNAVFRVIFVRESVCGVYVCVCVWCRPVSCGSVYASTPLRHVLFATEVTQEQRRQIFLFFKFTYFHGPIFIST